MSLKYKVEIIADDIYELMDQLQETYLSLHEDQDFVDRISNKGMRSTFFTKYANIEIIDPYHDGWNEFPELEEG